MRKLAIVPISATPAWITAVEAADCQCQCTEAVPGHTHARTEGQCRTVQGTAGGRLHLLADGAVMCHKCANHREKTAPASAWGPDDCTQESLFDLPERGAA